MNKSPLFLAGLVALVVSAAGVCWAAPEPASDPAAPSLQHAQEMVSRAQVLHTVGQTDQAAALAREALDVARRLDPGPEADALIMAALEVTTKAAPAESIAPGATGDPADRAEALLENAAESAKAPEGGVFSPEATAALNALMVRIDREAAPQAELLKYPDYPRRVSDVLTADELAARDRSQSREDWENSILKGLEQTVSFDFNGAPLSEVVEYLAALSGQNLLLDPRAGLGDAPITLQVHEMKLSSALKWLTRMARADYAIRREAVLISTAEYLEGESVVQTYDIADLTLDQHDFWDVPTAAGYLEALGPVDYEKLPEKYRADADKSGQGWTEFIRHSVDPLSWRTETNSRSANTISYRAGQIVVTQSPGVHRKIAQLLAAFRESRALMVSIQMRFLDVTTDYLQQIGVNWVGQDENPITTRSVLTSGGALIPAGFQSRARGSDDPAGPGPAADQHQPPYEWEAANINDPEVSLTNVAGETRPAIGGLFLDWLLVRDFQVRALLDAVERDRKGTLLTAPRITCFNTQRANIVLADEISYVASQSSGDEPEISTVADGALLEVQPFVSADRKYVTIEMRPALNDLNSLTEFIYLATTTTDANVVTVTERRIQIPEVSRRSVSCTVVVPVGGTLIIGDLSRSEDRSGYAGIPFLSQLPIINKFFRTDANVNNRTSLLMMVRADLIEARERPIQQ